MRHLLTTSIVILSFALAAPQALAHHSFAANYNINSAISVEGVVTRFSFRNPHVVVGLEVTNPDGSVTNWVAEAFAATSLRRAGWDRDTLKEGDLVRVSGSATHDGSPMVSLNRLEFLDVETGAVTSTIYGDEGERAAEGETLAYLIDMPLVISEGVPNLTGTWSSYGAPRSILRSGPPVAPFNDLGWIIQNAFSEVNDPQVYCDMPGLIRQGVMTPHPIRITQHEDRVVFEYEEYGVLREVYFDPEKAITGIKTHFGDSVARYENGALIVETINLLSEMANPEGNRLSDQTTLVETYKRVDQPDFSSLIEIKFVATDPLYLAENFVHSSIKMAAGKYEFSEINCEPPSRERVEVNPAMNLFLASVGPADGENYGGLADTHCAVLAANVGQGEKNWRGVLSTALNTASTTNKTGVNARDRIGTGPWYNAKGDVVAVGQDDLQSDVLGFTKQSLVSERGQIIFGQSEALLYCFAVN